MSSTPTAEERAREKAILVITPSLFDSLSGLQIAQRRLGYMKAWIDEVEPLEAESDLEKRPDCA